MKFRYELRPIFVIYFKFQANLFKISGLRIRKRCPKVMKLIKVHKIKYLNENKINC